MRLICNARLSTGLDSRANAIFPLSRTDFKTTKLFALALLSQRTRFSFIVALMLCGFAWSDSGVAQSTKPAAQLYFFTSQGCAPCRQVEPSIEALKHEGYDVTTVHLDRNPDWGQKFSVDRTPTVIMVANNRIIGRHAGLIDSVTLRQWFATVSAPDRQTNTLPNSTRPNESTAPIPKRQNQTGSRDGFLLATYAAVPETGGNRTQNEKNSETFTATPTMHRGTPKPVNKSEQQTMEATVRLRVQDKEGISYATGTVIHCHDGEWLVMTCGHAFREAGYNGKITAEYNFINGQIGSAPGELISYDAKARDVALIAVSAGRNIEPVQLAARNSDVERGQSVFSIGCDGGDNPTIRHSQIKNKAIYDGAVKYDIYGRPAIGRSGGGLFNGAGELIGVCNAAAVETDEGIYSALDSLHWQIAQSNLSHLFDGSNATESVSHGSKLDESEKRLAGLLDSNHREETFTNDPQEYRMESVSIAANTATSDRLDSNSEPTPRTKGTLPNFRQVQWNNELSRPQGSTVEGLDENSDQEIIIVVRSKSNPRVSESITITNPSRQLLNYLSDMKTAGESRQLDMARLRHKAE